MSAENILNKLEQMDAPGPKRRRRMPYFFVVVAAAGGTLFLTSKKDNSDDSRDVVATSTTAVYKLDTQTLPPTLPPGEVGTTIDVGAVLPPIEHHPTSLPSGSTTSLVIEQAGVNVDPATAESHDHPAVVSTVAPEVAQQVATPANPDTHQHPLPVVTSAATEQPATVTIAATHEHPTPVVVSTAAPVATPAPTPETAPATLAPVGTPETVPPTIAPPAGTIAVIPG